MKLIDNCWTCGTEIHEGQVYIETTTNIMRDEKEYILTLDRKCHKCVEEVTRDLINGNLKEMVVNNKIDGWRENTASTSSTTFDIDDIKDLKDLTK